LAVPFKAGEPGVGGPQQLVNDAFSFSLEFWMYLVVYRPSGAALSAFFAADRFHRRDDRFRRFA
jgi:hypothetical protein